MKALIKVGYACNNHCSFCHTLDVRHIDDSKDGVHAKIERAAQLGYSMAVLSGGEPTMRPSLLRWAKHAALRGLDFGLVTNGRMLAYPELVDKLVDRRLKYVYMSLHGGTAKVHNAMVRAHAFEDTFGAIKVLSGRGLDLTVNAVVTNTNVDKLLPIVDLLLPFDDVVLKFSMVEPKGAADKLFNAVMPRVEHVARRVLEAIEYGKSRSTGLTLGHGGIPFCLLRGHEDGYDDLRTHGFASMTEVYEPDFYPVDDANKQHTPRCFDCGLQGACPGLYKGYQEVFGDAELKPVHGVRSNSFNFVAERSLTWPDGEMCPIRGGGVLPYDRGRHLFVRNGTALEQYRTVTRDFSDGELDHVKGDLGQLYLDASEKSAPDDFATDLKKLHRVDACATCPMVDSCAWCFEVRSGPSAFERDDARLQSILGDIRGDVLDVGCGEGRYGDLFEALHRDGHINYTGVEPDSDAASSYRAAHPGAQVLCSDIESVPIEPASYDWILVLRSYNHIRELAPVMKRFAKGLKPGGTLVVCDNTAFGLVRSTEQASRGEDGPAIFEHYRNHNSSQAARVIAETGLMQTLEIPVTPDTSNQWLLCYERPVQRP